MTSFPVFLSLFLVLVPVFFKWKKSIANQSSSHLPPGPWKLPLIGNIHQLAGYQIHHRFTDLAKTHGPVMSFQLGQVPAVIISSPETAKQALKIQETNFLERPSFLASDIILYNRSDIIFAPYGDSWRQMKKIAVEQLLSSKRVQSFKSVREDEVSNFIKSVYSKVGSPVNLSQMLLSLNYGIISVTSLGKKHQKQEQIIRVVADAIRASGGFSIADAFPSFKLLHVITGMSLNIRRIHRRADEILEEIISEHKANKTAAAGSKKEADTVLDVLLEIEDRQNLKLPLTEDNIKATILEMFGAASDTTSATTEWAMSEMIKNPRVMKKAQDEVRRVFNEKGNVDESEFHRLKYLKLVIKETLRLHPPLALIPRECSEKSNLNGYDIYPKTRVLINVWAIGRDPVSWIDPDRFYPERFLESSIDFKGTNFEFLPFGAGKRMCVGITMAMANIDLILAQLLYHFNWKLPDDAQPESLDMSDVFCLAIKRKLDLHLIPFLDD